MACNLCAEPFVVVARKRLAYDTTFWNNQKVIWFSYCNICTYRSRSWFGGRRKPINVRHGAVFSNIDKDDNENTRLRLRVVFLAFGSIFLCVFLLPVPHWLGWRWCLYRAQQAERNRGSIRRWFDTGPRRETDDWVLLDRFKSGCVVGNNYE